MREENRLAYEFGNNRMWGYIFDIKLSRNKELMRIYRDVELVESLGSGIPRILEHMGKIVLNLLIILSVLLFR